MRKYLVLLLVAAFAFCAMPAMAQAPALEKSVDFYGQVWFWTGYEKNDKDVSNPALPDDPAKDAGYEETDHTWAIEYPVTRFGANFKQGNFKGNVELNTGDKSVGSAVAYRQWWGEHTFTDLGGLRLLIGHTYSPTYQPAYLNNRGGLNGYAGSFTLTSSRTSMIRLTVPTGAIGNVMLAFVKPCETTPTNYSTTNNYLQSPYPKMEAVYNLDMKLGDAGAIKASVGGGYQVLDIYARTAAGGPAGTEVGDKITSVKSYGFGGTVCAMFGPVTVKASSHMVKNGKEYGDNSSALTSSNAVYNVATGDIDDTDTIGAHGAVSFKINPMFTAKAGYGMSLSERTSGTVKTEANKSLMYANLDIQMTPNIMLSPEFAIKDNGEQKVGSAKTKRGKETSYGILWFLKF